MLNQVGIYRITCLVNRKVYIGQTVNLNKRKKIYSKVGCVGQPKIYNSIKKHGWKNHKFTVLETFRKYSDKVNKREVYWKKHYIKLYGLNNMLFCEIYDKGGGPKSEESIEKQRLKMTGRKQSDESNKKRSKTMKALVDNKWRERCRQNGLKGKGKIVSEETKEKQRKMALERKPPTQEMKDQISKTLKTIGHKPPEWAIEKSAANKRRAIIQRTLQGKFIKKWTSATLIKKTLGFCIDCALSTKCNTSHGYFWEYEDMSCCPYEDLPVSVKL